MIISKYYYIFPFILSLVTYYLLFKESKLKEENDMPKNYIWLKYMVVMVGVLFLIMSVIYIFFKEQFNVALRNIIFILNIIWLIGIVVWIRKLNTKIA